MDCNIILIVNEKMFCEYANMIKYSLEELGHNAEIVTDISKGTYKKDQLNIVTKSFRNISLPPCKMKNVLYQSEELWHSRDSGLYDPRESGERWIRTLELYKDNAILPKKNNHKVYWCPYGYSKAYETNLPKVDEDIDILFFGSSNNIREDFWNKLCNFKSLKKYKFVYLENTYGIERDEYIMRSKIVINLKWSDRWSYPPLRALFAQCKKKMFMCHDPNGGIEPYIENKHFISFKNIEHFEELIDKWLNDDKKRNEFAMNAYEDIKENYNFTKFLSKAMKGIL
jgi:hypothetical protein